MTFVTQGAWGSSWPCWRRGWSSRQGETSRIYQICWSFAINSDQNATTMLQCLLKGVWRHTNRAGGEDSGAEENETTSEGGEVFKSILRYRMINVPGPECRDQRHTVGVWKR